MNEGRVILESKRFHLTLLRLCHELIENYEDFQDVCLVGIQSRGVKLADRIYHLLTRTANISKLPYGKLDITFYRDDFRTRSQPIAANRTEMDFLVDHKKVILIDDVLYSGRTVQAALTALNHYGRPAKVDLLTLVDRRFNRHLPIEAHYTGIVVDALDEAYVRVQWDDERQLDDKVLLFSAKGD